MNLRRAALAASVAALVAGCDVSPRLYLTVRTEAGSRVDHVRVEVYSPSGSEAGLTDGSINPSISPARPFEMRILGRVGGERVRVSVDGFEGDDRLVHQEWVASMPSEGAGYLQVVLWNSCVDVECPAGSTCSSSGRCVRNEATMLPASATDAGLGFCPEAGTNGCAAIDVTGVDAGFDAGSDVAADAPRDAGADAAADVPRDVGVDAPRCPGPSAASVEGWTRCASGVWCPNLCGPGTTCLDVERIGMGRFHGCALRSDRGVSCWGFHDDGRLGDGRPNNDAGVVRTPVGVLRAVTDFPLTAVTALSVGYDGACTTDPGGLLLCWGSINSDPLLQDFTPGFAATPARRLQRADAGASANLFDGVATHEGRTCALVRGGGVRCSAWVRNLPDGTSETIDDRGAIPTVDVARAGGAPLAGAVEVGVGTFHGCARLGDGTVSCWGSNQYGQLGAPLPDGDAGGVGASDVARPVPGVAGATSLAVGDLFSCVLAAGEVRCWGNGSYGRVGGFTRTVACVNGNACAPTPVAVEGLAELVEAYRSPAVQITAGAEEGCVRLANGHVWCWGYNQSGQLGLPTTGAGAVDQRGGVAGPPVFTGADHVVTGGSGGGGDESWTCARRAADCTWWCWGRVPGEAAPPADLGTPRLLRWGG